MTNEEVAREIAGKAFDRWQREGRFLGIIIEQEAQAILDRAYPPLPADVGELVAEGRATHHQYRIPDGKPCDGQCLILRLCDALEAAHSAPVDNEELSDAKKRLKRWWSHD